MAIESRVSRRYQINTFPVDQLRATARAMTRGLNAPFIARPLSEVPLLGARPRCIAG
jgi:hypothetical protein